MNRQDTTETHTEEDADENRHLPRGVEFSGPSGSELMR